MPSMREAQKETIRSNKGRTHFTFRGIRLGGCLFLCSILACKAPDSSPPPDAIDKIQALAVNGDVIVRNGTDEVSNAARSFNRRDHRYSHCGLIQVEQDTVFVYHALGGAYNPSQKLLRETLQHFCGAADIDKVAIFRYPLDKDENEQLSSWIKEQYRKELPFDLFFSFESDDRMYCSEFVFKALNAAKNGRLKSLLPQNDEALYVTIDDLYLNGWVRKVSELQW